MGKKKDERKRREAEAETQAGEHRCGGPKSHKHGRGKHDGTAPLAGIAAMVARQMGTPAGRQVIATGLMMAANAISAKGAKASPPPRPPEPPMQPEPPVSPVEAASPGAAASTGPFAGDTPEPPRSDAPALPPEIAKVIETVAARLERFAAGFGKPGNTEPPKV